MQREESLGSAILAGVLMVGFLAMTFVILAMLADPGAPAPTQTEIQLPE